LGWDDILESMTYKIILKSPIVKYAKTFCQV
jgi:hypothetical protein